MPGSRQGWARSWGSRLPLTHKGTPAEGTLVGPWEPIRRLKISVLRSPPTPTSRESSLVLPPARPASWQTHRWLLTIAKITFPGKCFHLLKRTQKTRPGRGFPPSFNRTSLSVIEPTRSQSVQEIFDQNTVSTQKYIYF